MSLWRPFLFKQPYKVSHIYCMLLSCVFFHILCLSDPDSLLSSSSDLLSSTWFIQHLRISFKFLGKPFILILPWVFFNVPISVLITCTLMVLALLSPTPLSWKWSHLNFLVSVVTIGHVLISEDLELGVSHKRVEGNSVCILPQQMWETQPPHVCSWNYCIIGASVGVAAVPNAPSPSPAVVCLQSMVTPLCKIQGPCSFLCLKTADQCRKRHSGCLSS